MNIEKIIKLEKQIKELDETINWECDGVVANKMERELLKLKDKQQELIDELSDKELDALNQKLNQKPQKRYFVKIYKKDTWIDKGIKNETWVFTKILYVKNEQELNSIKEMYNGSEWLIKEGVC